MPQYLGSAGRNSTTSLRIVTIVGCGALPTTMIAS